MALVYVRVVSHALVFVLVADVVPVFVHGMRLCFCARARAGGLAGGRGRAGRVVQHVRS